MYESVKINRNPDWVGGTFHCEFKDQDGNTFGTTGLSFDGLVEALKLHFKVVTEK